MEILKKNIGLILAVVVCLGFCAYLGARLLVMKGNLAEIEKKLDSEKGFFDKVRKSKIRVLPDSGVVVNVVQAQKNSEKASLEYKRLCKNLGTKYQINPKLPFTSTEAIRWIRENLEEMAEFAVSHDMVIQNLGREFSVILTRGNLASNEFRTVFRMLYVYRRVIEILAKSGVKEVYEIRWPLQFGVHEADRYTITPINISIAGNGDIIQNFLNNMSSDTKMLFYLRTMSLEASDDFSEAVQQKVRHSERPEEQKMLEGGRRDGGDFFAEEKRLTRKSVQQEQNAAVSDKKSDYPEHWVRLEPKRQDWFGFAPVRVGLKARFDLLEFKVDEEDK